MLNLNDALHVAQILLPYMPDDASEISVLAFGDKIVSGIIQAGKHPDYLRIVYLLSGVDPDHLVHLSPIDTFQLFVEGLQENEILSLIEFYRGLKEHGNR